MPQSENPSNLSDIAERILAGNRQGTLATMSHKHADFPFASIAPFALLPDGRPLFLFSSMSVHSRNLKRTAHATLLVTETDQSDLSGGRVSVVGQVVPLDAALVETATEAYLAAHPEAQQWISFGDFAFYTLDAIETYVVAGFGNMGWVKPV